jgi:alanine dehydrogenase
VTVRILTDEDVRDQLTARKAVTAAQRCLVDAYGGALLAPPRLHTDIGDLELAFAVGGYREGPVGFRVYGTWPGESDQLIPVWRPDGRLLACVIGSELGARRTGALGAAAVDALARSDADEVAVIGSGRQAWSQVWAMSAIRTPRAVRVFSPHPEHRRVFAERAVRELGMPAAAVSEPREAVLGAGIVILATTSEHDVIEADWIEPGTHVNTVGPKTRSAHETPPGLVENADLAVTDSPAQVAAYSEPFFTDRQLVHLGAILAGAEEGRRAEEEITVYCSTGLAGSEVVMALALAGRGTTWSHST